MAQRLRRYWRSLLCFWATSMEAELEYQLNLVIELLAVLGNLAGSLFLLVLLAGPRGELGGWSWNSALVVLGIVAIQAAFVLRFLLQTLVAMLCFWSERAAALDRLLLIPYLFLSGLVAPLESFPPAVRRIAECTPFPAMVSFPAKLLAGESVDVGAGFLNLALWCAVLFPLSRLLWRAGVRRYSAMGA